VTLPLAALHSALHIQRMRRLTAAVMQLDLAPYPTNRPSLAIIGGLLALRSFTPFGLHRPGFPWH